MRPKPNIVILLLTIFMCLGFSLGVNAKESVLENTDSLSSEVKQENTDEPTPTEETSGKTQNKETAEEPKENALTKNNDSEKTNETAQNSVEATETDKKSAVSSEKKTSTQKSTATKDVKNGESTEENTKTVITKKSTSKSAETKDNSSGYVVEFSHKNSSYILNGDESVELNKILDKIKITGKTVENVECSNTNLFSASKKSGEWIVTSHKAFKSDEWMKVTLDGETYKIKVTDATSFGTNLTWELHRNVLYIKATNTSSNSMPDAYTTNQLFPGLDPYKVESIVFADGVKNIGAYAFSHFTQLKAVSISTTVTSIGTNAFQNAPSTMHVCYWKFSIPSSGNDISINNLKTACGNSFQNAFPNVPNANFHALNSLNIGYSSSSDHVYWCYASSVSTIFVSGVGEMKNWSEGSSPFNASGVNAATTLIICGENKDLGENAFWNMTSLKNVYIYCPDTFTRLCRYAFQKCTNLETINLPDSVTEIKTKAFDECKALKAVSWSDPGNGVVRIPSSITTIADMAFQRCNSFTKVLLQSSITNVMGEDAFWRSTDASTATLYFWGESANSATLNAKCYGTNTSKSFTRYSFQYVSKEIGASNNWVYTVTVNGYCVMRRWDKNGSSNTGTIKDYTENSSDRNDWMSATKVIFLDGVTATGKYLFQGCATLKSAYMPDVTNIKQYSFTSCSNLEDVFMPVVTTIGYRTFQNCTKLKCGSGDLVLPNSLTNISEGAAFENCSGFTGTLYVSSGLAGTGNYSFKGCSGFNNVFIPNSLTGSSCIGKQMFYGLKAGVNIYYDVVITNDTHETESTFISACNEGAVTGTFTYDLSDSNANHYNFYFKTGSYLYYTIDSTGAVSIIRNPLCTDLASSSLSDWSTGPLNGAYYVYGPFYRHSASGNTGYASPSITSVNVVASIDNISAVAFKDCTSLASVTLPSSVTQIGRYAFNNCTSLSSISFSNITSIGEAAFEGDISLTSLTLSSSLSTLDSAAFNGCSGIEGTLTIPSSLSAIKSTTFQGCSSLDNIVIPSSISVINQSAFEDTKNGANFYCSNAYSKENLGTQCKNDGGTAQNDIAYSFNNHANQNFYFQCGDNLWYKLSGTNDTTATIVAYPSNAADKTMWNWILNDATHPTPSPFTNIQSNDTYPITNIDLGVATTVGSNAFNGCTGLTNTIIPDSITSIGQNAFAGTSDNANFYCGIAYNKTNLGTYCKNISGTAQNNIAYSFDNHADQNFYFKCGPNAWYKLTGTNENIVNISVYPSDAQDKTMTNWSNTSRSPFEQYLSSTITSLNISDVTSIGNWAFYNCSNLEGNLSIPNTVTSIGEQAFHTCTGLDGTLTLPSSLTEIKYAAFAGCTNLTGDLVVPGNVTTIGSTAFLSCGFDGAITISSGVTTISEYAFYQCGNFSDATIPSTVTTIGQDAFSSTANNVNFYCSNATSKANLATKCYNSTLTNSFANAANQNFYFQCGDNLWYTTNSSDTTATITVYPSTAIDKTMWNWIPSDATHPTPSPFSGMSTTLTTINFGDATTIGSYAFNGCTNIGTTLTIPDTITALGNYAFNGCTGLTNIIIPSSIASANSIGQNAFASTSNNANFYCGNAYNKTNLATKCYNSTLTSSFGNAANQNFYFQCGDNLWYVLSGTGDSVATITVYPSGATDKTMWNWIPSDATHPTPSPFTSMSATLTTVNFGTATTIGSYAFNNCTSLGTTLTIPSTITTVGNYAFNGCSGVTRLDIPNAITSIGDHSFTGLASGTDIYYNNTEANRYNPSGNLASKCYDGTGSDTDATKFTNSFGFTSDSTTSGHYVFHFKCGDHLWYSINSGAVTIISDGTTQSSFPMWNYTTGASSSPFYSARASLTSLSISDATTIGNYAFQECTGLAGTLTIPSNVTTIGYYAFYNCSGFTGNLNIPGGVTTINNFAFYNCTGFNGTLTLPNSITKIAQSAFGNCSGFTGTLALPNNLTTLESSAFYGCSGFTGTLIIPSSLTTIYSATFRNCSGLDNIVIPHDITAIRQNAFQGTKNGANFYCYNAYSKENLGTYCENNSGVAQNDIAYSFGNHANQHFYFQCGDNLWYELSGTNDTTAKIVAYPSDAVDKTMWDWILNDTTHPTPSPFASIQSNDTYPLTNIDLGAATTVGDNAFNSCTGLTDTIISSTVTSIGQDAFSGTSDDANFYCSNASSKANLATKCDSSTLVNSFDNAADQNFYFQCGDNLWYTTNSGETTATITVYPSDATDKTMWNWIPSDTTHPTPSPFTSISATLTTVDLGAAATIGSYAFNNCTGLGTILAIPSTVTMIGDYAFNGCSGVTRLDIPNTLANVVIASADSEETMTIYAIGNHAFTGLASGADIYYDNTQANRYNPASDLASKCYDATGSDTDATRLTNSFGFTSDSTIANHYVFHFKCGNHLWYSINGTSSNKTLTIVGDGYVPSGTGSDTAQTAFEMWNYTATAGKLSPMSDQNAIKTINITDATTIGDYSLRYTGITNITIPASITSINIAAISNCRSLTNVTFESTGNLETIGESAFGDCSTLTTIDIPYGVDTIGAYAFNRCQSLATVVIPSTVTNIGQNAFNNKNSAGTITPENAKFYCGNAYSKENLGTYCTNSSGVAQNDITYSFPNHATANQHFYFQCGDNLWYELSGTNDTEATIVAYPSNAADKTMWNFIGEDLPSPFVSIQENDTHPITNINLGAATTVGNYAFNGCIDLTSVIIPNTITNTTIESEEEDITVYGIGSGAFLNLGCTEVPPTIVNIFYAGKQSAFTLLCDTSIDNCFDFAVGASNNLLYHFTQDITYVPNSGTMPVPTTPVSYETNAGGSVTLATPTRSNYQFVGWCTDAELTTTPILAFTADNTQFGDKTFYAKWTQAILTRSILYYCQYGSIATPTVTEYMPGSGVTLNLDTPKRNGYAFCGWHEDVTLSNVDVPGGLPGEKVVSSYNDAATRTFEVGDNTNDVSFYAEWYQCTNVNYWVSSNDMQQTLSSDYEIVKTCDSTWGGTIGSTYWYVLKDNVTLTEPITVTGNVNLILKDDCTLTSSDIITVNAGEGNLTIYAQQGDSTYNAPIDEENDPLMQFSKYTERTTKKYVELTDSQTSEVTRYYLDSDTVEGSHYVVTYDKSTGDKYLLYYSATSGKVMFKLNPSDTFSVNGSGNLVYNGTVYTYDSSNNALKNSEDDSYLSNMITSAGGTAITTTSPWNNNNSSFCYYTQNAHNYYENTEHVLVDETNGNTPTNYHFDADSGSTIGYTQSPTRGRLIIDVSGTPNTSDACIGGAEGQMNGNITINGGEINIQSNSSAACIGSGDCSSNGSYQSNSSQITIYGGNVTAINYYNGATKPATIGGGYNSSGGTITISGGQLTLVSSDITIGAGQGGTKNTNPTTTINLNWKNKTDYIDSQCGGFDSENTNITINSQADRFLYQRRGTAAAGEGSGVIVSCDNEDDNLSTNKNFKIIPFVNVEYTLIYPMSGVIIPFRTGSAYAFGCETTNNTKGIGICTMKDDPTTLDIDETFTVVKPYCLSLTATINVLKRVKNYTTVDGVRQAVYYASNEAGYDEISFDIVEITSVDGSGNITGTGDSINEVRNVFAGNDYNYNSGRESTIDGVKDSIALKFGSDTMQSKKSGIYQGSVSFTSASGIIEDENVNQWEEFFS